MTIDFTTNRPPARRAFRLAAGIQAIITLAVLATLALSCSRGSSAQLALPPSPLLSRGLGWGLVVVSYARIKEDPAVASRDSGMLRKGVVLELEESRFDSTVPGVEAFWYRVKTESASGWVHSSELDVFQTRAQALAAAGKGP
jgi:hypothetical protein